MLFANELKESIKKYSTMVISVSKDKNVCSLRNEILKKTNFLDSIPNIKMITRLYCIRNNVDNIPLCKACKTKECIPNKLDGALGFTIYCSPDCSRKESQLNTETLEKLKNRDWLYNQRIVLEKSKDVIAEELGCSTVPINSWIKKHGIPKVKYNESNTKALLFLRDKNWLVNKHKNEKMKCEDIAKSIGSSKATVSVWLAKHGIDANKTNSYDRKFNKTTKPMLEINDFIKTFYDGEIKINSRKVLNGPELDIYLPEKKFAIEYNGVYHHLYRPEEKNSSIRKDSNYHNNKTVLCKILDITLFHIFSSSWNNKKEIWKSMIKNKLLYNDKKIYARNCEIKEVSVFEKNTFLEKNHLQGKDKSKIKLGLYHNNNNNDELIAIMTFSKARYNKKYDWEMTRFAGLLNTNIIGGFSKLLAHFRKNYKGSIITYADRLHSFGNVYIKNGFKHIKTNPPNYYWVLDNTETLVHRSNFTKKKLNIPKNITEEHFMYDKGYRKIFDCGTMVFTI